MERTVAIVTIRSCRTRPRTAGLVSARRVLQSLLTGLSAGSLFTLGSAQAGNGMLPTGFGVESQGLGGADVALSRDTTAVNTNPAGLAQTDGQAADAYLSPFMALHTEHRDALGNESTVDNKLGFLSGGSYARKLGEGLVVGGGLFVQGGTGFTYTDLDTGFGTRDDLLAQFGVFKLATAAAWQPDARWRLGVGLGFSYGTARQKVFPNTSDSSAPFFGYRIDSLAGQGINGKLGAQFLASDTLTLGFAYTSEAPLDLYGGTLTANFDAIGLGRVTYGNARLEGLSFAQQIELGAVWRPSDAWLVSMELEWIDWSSAMRSVRLDAREPDNPDAPASFGYVSPLGWRDQYPISIGALYRLDPRTQLRAGYSHAQHPAPGRNQNPVFAVIAENQLALGLRRVLKEGWTLDLGLEYQPYREHHYDNPALPIGVDATETNNYLWFHFMIGRRWS
ncbi:MAG: outer membrane protein transport protein [Sinimarinibacterium sp.]|jgi:long-chain fatty acid transport protein